MGDEMLLYVGANSTQLRMDDVRPIGTEISTGLTSAQLDTAKRRLAANARAAGAQLTCHYQRTESQLEVPIPETAESALLDLRLLESRAPRAPSGVHAHHPPRSQYLLSGLSLCLFPLSLRRAPQRPTTFGGKLRRACPSRSLRACRL